MIDGPRPQINFPGLAGEKNTEWLMSPKPVAPLPGVPAGMPGVPAINPSTLTTAGMIVRLIRFKLPTVIGMTGWMFKKKAPPSGAPKSKVYFERKADHSAHWILRLGAQVLTSLGLSVGTIYCQEKGGNESQYTGWD